jgi:hypothetical protein
MFRHVGEDIIVSGLDATEDVADGTTGNAPSVAGGMLSDDVEDGSD